MTVTTIDPSKDLQINGRAIKPRSALIDAVGVTVETYLGAVDMTVAELNALQNGGVIVLDTALNAEVELKVNGMAIARGELVAVGDKFGVRITTLAP